MLRLLLTFAFGSASLAAAVSGPSESRVPRAAEADAIIRAVCSGKVDLGRLNKCKQTIYDGRPSSEIRSPKTMLTLSSILPGSFTAPNQREILATFCTETETCSGETVLLRHTRGEWQPVSLVPNFLPFQCLTYPRKNGTQAAVCMGENAKNEPIGRALKMASWTGGKLKVETVALFPYLSYVEPKSEQCQGRWDYQPYAWSDRDRDLSGVPDLSIVAVLDIYKDSPELCTRNTSGRLRVGGGRRDLTFVWTGETLKPTGTTAATLAKYASGR